MLYTFDVDLAVMYNKCVLTVNLFVTVIEYSVGEGEEESNGAMDDKIEVLPLENARGQEKQMCRNPKCRNCRNCLFVVEYWYR